MIDVYVTGSSVDIGRQGENNARNVYFDLTDLTTDYGVGTATLVHMRPSDQAPYVCETETDGSYLVWTPSSTDTAYSGAGKCELRWVVGETLAKSIIYTTTIAPSITGAGEVPSPYKSWYDAIIAYIEANYAANGAPQEVREAIYTLLSKAAYTETGLTDELAIVQAWTAETISVTNNLTHVTNSNTATMAEQGGSYTGTLTADSGYSLGTVTVTMGGEDVTATAYSSGTITIPSVTGNIVITATAVPAVASLSAVYTQSGTVYDTDALDTLKADLVVTATYSDSSTAVIPSTAYTLSGTLTEGSSTVTVSYGGKTTTFSVTVSIPTYQLANGTHEFTLSGATGYVTITDHSHIKIDRTTNSGNGNNYICISDLNYNGTSIITNTNINNHDSIFSLNSNDRVRFVIKNVSGSFDDYTVGLRLASGTTSVVAFAGKTTDFDETSSVLNASNVGCLFVYVGTAYATYKDIEFDIEVYVNDIRYF